MQRCDLLIVGSGIAGLTCALKLTQHNPDKKIVIVTKAGESESNTKYAQGGVAVVLDQIKDSYEQHIQDTIHAGDGLCDYDVVKGVITEGPVRFQELIAWGAKFDKKNTGDFDLSLEGGHAHRRVIHHKDITGYEIEKTLLAQVKKNPNITLLTQHFAIDLITQHQLINREEADPKKTRCYGAYIFDKITRRTAVYTAKMTLLASGGSGQVYKNTTNPTIATGDGIAMAYRAKAKISGMEFIQFHPTALYNPTVDRCFLISEAVRGFGALLRNSKKELFMERYDPRKELASRDIVSRAIDNELKQSGDDYLYMDCRHLDLAVFEQKFPNISRKCAKIGLDLRRDMIPVAPAAHYFCGGIEVDKNGQTTVDYLMACGECSNTGLHGANRLASNSLLEALVFAHRCYMHCINQLDTIASPPPILHWNEEGTIQPREHVLITHNKKELKAIMSDYVGIVRSDERLHRAAIRLKILYEETESLYKKTRVSPSLFELRNLITVAYLIVQQSIVRKENKGVFYNIDKVKKSANNPPLGTTSA